MTKYEGIYPADKDRPKKLGLDDFTFIKVLGKGSFGKVWFLLISSSKHIKIYFR